MMKVKELAERIIIDNVVIEIHVNLKCVKRVKGVEMLSKDKTAAFQKYRDYEVLTLGIGDKKLIIHAEPKK